MSRIPLPVKTVSHPFNKEENKGLTSEEAEARTEQTGCQKEQNQ
jgi:hypothetical protein